MDTTAIERLKAVGVALVALWLTGCDTLLQPATPQSTSPPARTTTNSVQQFAPVTDQPPSSPKPASAPPAVQPARSSPAPAEAKPAAAQAGAKGAERLLSPPAAVPRAVEKGVARAETATKAAIAEAGGDVGAQPLKELVIKGSPRPPQPRSSGFKKILWFGLGLGVVAVLGVGAQYHSRRQMKLSSVDLGKDDIVLPPELEMRETSLTRRDDKVLLDKS
jgi:hypothetical protein